MNKKQSPYDLHNSYILNYSVAIKMFQNLLVVIVFLGEVKFYGIYKLNSHLVDFLGDIPVT